MHIVILASTPSIAEEMQTAMGGTADRYTIATDWASVVACLKHGLPAIILIERTTLAQIKLSELLSLAEPGRWPPVLVTDISPADVKRGVALTHRLSCATPPYYQIGDLRIDTRRKRARLGERWVTLPPIQYRLLLTLAERSGEVVDCQELLRTVWGYEGEESEARELVKVHIRQIRRRLELDQQEYPYIHSVRGFGYTLVPPEED
jgi:DNA-binding winged helix-turn-helix (wHTH) protein